MTLPKEMISTTSTVASRLYTPRSRILLPLTLFIAVALPLLFSRGMPSTLPGWLIFSVCVWSGARITAITLSDKPEIVRFFGYFFFYVVDGLAALVQYNDDTWPYPPPVNSRDITTAALANLFFLLGYELASRFSAKRKNNTSIAKKAHLQIATNRLWAVCLLALIISFYELHKFGGPSSLFTSRADRTSTVSDLSTGSLGLNGALFASPIFVCAYVLLAARKQGLIHRRALLTSVTVLAALLISNPLSTARYGVLTVYAGLLLAALSPLTRKKMVCVVVSLVIGLFIVFPFLNSFRNDTASKSTFGSISSQFSTGDFDAFQQTINTVEYAQFHGFQHGTEEASALLFFVPRSLWSGKHLDTGVTVAQFKGYSFNYNLSDPLPAESYIDGGLFLALIVGVLFGMLSSLLDRHLQLEHRSGGYLALFGPIFAVYQLIILRGSLLQAVGNIVAIALFLRLCMQRRTSLAELSNL